MSYDDIRLFLGFQVSYSYSVFSLFLVIEIDMPWKDNCEEKYGDSFRPWTEDDLQQAIGIIIAALPHNRLTTIVSLIFLTLTIRFQVYHSPEQRGFVHKVLALDHKLVQDMYMWKHGIISILLTSLDASHTGNTMFCPAVEHFALALTHPSDIKPIFRSLLYFLISF